MYNKDVAVSFQTLLVPAPAFIDYIETAANSLTKDYCYAYFIFFRFLPVWTLAHVPGREKKEDKVYFELRDAALI